MKKMPISGVLIFCLLLPCLSLQPVQANTFYLNQSSELSDRASYATVNVNENSGNLDFIVTALGPLNWKISKFFFNLSGNTGNVTISGLPSGWSLASGSSPYNASEFGLFSNAAGGTGSSLQNTFSFTVDGSNSLSLANLIANDEGWIFAGHSQCQNKNTSTCVAVDDESSHFIAGGTGEVSNVPLAAAIWLFGSAIAGLGTLKRRKND
jgi:hypothetical protein